MPTLTLSVTLLSIAVLVIATISYFVTAKRKLVRPGVNFGPAGIMTIAATKVTITARYHTETISLFRRHWDVAITSFVLEPGCPPLTEEEVVAIAASTVREIRDPKGEVVAYFSEDS